MTSTRPHLRRRRLIGSALAAAVLFAGAMSACSPSPSQLQQVESTALSASQVKERVSKTPTSTDYYSTPIGEDFLHVSAPELTEKEKAQRGRQDRSGANSSIVARYRGSDGSVLWAREIKPAVVNWRDDDGSSAQDVAHDLLAWRPAGYAVVSPDGDYVSLVLRPPQMRPVLHDSDEDRNPLDVAAQRTHVLVLDAATGDRLVADLLTVGASQGRGTLLITHRLSALAHADEVMVMGRPPQATTEQAPATILHRGSHDSLQNVSDAYRWALSQEDQDRQQDDTSHVSRTS